VKLRKSEVNDHIHDLLSPFVDIMGPKAGTPDKGHEEIRSAQR
jgi:hypothetical protein